MFRVADIGEIYAKLFTNTRDRTYQNKDRTSILFSSTSGSGIFFPMRNIPRGKGAELWAATGESGDASVGDTTLRVAPADGHRREASIHGLLALEGPLADVAVVVHQIGLVVLILILFKVFNYNLLKGGVSNLWR